MYNKHIFESASRSGCLLFTILIIVQSHHTYANDGINWIAEFPANNLTMHMNDDRVFNVTLRNLNKTNLIATNATIYIRSDSDILQITKAIPASEVSDDGKWSGEFGMSAVFLGTANIYVAVVEANGRTEFSPKQLKVIITRPERFIDKMFTMSVIALVSILYINFGAALDLRKVKGVLLQPIGPAIAFFCHFIFLPLSAYVLGLILFRDNVELQLGLFFTGTSPAGGASNIWTVILGGNLDLSITMSTTSTLAAFAMMPLWIFTLGKTIFDRGDLGVPYRHITTSVVGLIIPLGIGLLIQRFCPRMSRFLVRILKTFSSILIIFIVVFAIFTNLYLFKLFTWQIFVAGLALPWLGYFIGWLVALTFRQEYEDRLAIAVEAGIQNTGISIFILRLALDQPQADLTTVVPVAVAIMTPFPLIAYYLCYKGRELYRRRRTRNYPLEIKECIRAQESGVY